MMPRFLLEKPKRLMRMCDQNDEYDGGIVSVVWVWLLGAQKRIQGLRSLIAVLFLLTSVVNVDCE